MTRAHIDFETRSAADLKKVGAHRYAQDPTTEIICMSYRLDDGPILRWLPGEAWPLDLNLHTGVQIVAHNAAFERAIWNAKAPADVGELTAEQQDCTLSRAAAMGLPIALDKLGAALRAPVQKDAAGHRLMLKMCKPRTHAPLTWHEEPSDVERLRDYCDQDVLSECAVDASLPPLSARERRVWELDQTINDRGVAVDVSLVRKALDAVEAAKKRGDRAIWRLTDGVVKKTSEVARIVDWLNARGHDVSSLAEGDLDALILRCELFDDDTAADVLRRRRAGAKAFKFQAMLDCVCSDGRVRGSLSYHGAHTGRWSGRGIQPQNFKRLSDGDEERVAATLASLAVGGDADLDVLSLCSKAMIVAAPGNVFIGGDFSNIEGRINAWLAGEEWKLDAFRAYDAGTGPDLYRIMAADVARKPLEAVTKDDRQVRGKVPELACGYGGGVGAFQKMAYTQRPPVRITDEQASAIVRRWRLKNQAIVKAWADLQEAAITALDAKGAIVSCLRDKVRYVCKGDFLFCRLPSERVISYAAPVVEWKRKLVTIDGEEVELNRRGVSYWGTKGGRWLKQDLYGGSQCNHVVQGLARDLLVEAMFRVEAAGYPIVLTAHDEILSEVPEGWGSVEAYEALMSELPSWAEGLPVTTKAWTGERYSK